MLEVNPVLAGTFDAPGYAAANNYAQATNQATDTDGVTGPDPRRFTKFDHSDTDAGTANLSFSDLVDMFNPLEHIPVISSVYRAITGEEINPVSRVAGDILYGGALGVASAVFGGVSAIADAGLEEQTGKDSGGLAIAALFGPDDDNKNVQLANNGTQTGVTPASVAAAAPATNPSVPATQKIELSQAANPTPLLAALAVPTNGMVPLPPGNNTSSPDIPAPKAQTVSATTANAAGNSASFQPTANGVAQNPSPGGAQSSVSAAGVSLASAGTASTAAPLGGIPLAGGKSSSSRKQPFGGVMGVPNMQAQDMALALSQGQPSLRMGHMIYTNNLASGQHALPPMLSSGNARATPSSVVAPTPVLPASFTPASVPGPAAAVTGSTQTPAPADALASQNLQSSLPAGLMQDMMLKALSQYGKVASGPYSGTGTGGGLNLVN